MSSVAGSSSLASYWFKFFLDAGIPPADAGNYAVAFTENRIQQSMMCDLSKDYLNDMGITVMGDTIAILKHAKLVHSQNAREKALRCSGLSTPAVSSTPVSKTASTPITSKDSASKTLSTVSTLIATTKTQPTPAAPQTKAVDAAKRPVSDRKDGTSSTKTTPVTSSSSLTSATTTKPASESSSGVVRLKPAQREEVPVKRVRSVTKEQEGAYKVTLPAGKIDRTRRLIEKTSEQRAAPGVFSRLGKEKEMSDDESSSESSGSSSPEVITDNKSARQRTAVIQSHGTTSIFSRLGGIVPTKRDGDAAPPVKTFKLTPITMSPSKDNKPATNTTTKASVVKPSTVYTQKSEGIFGVGAGASAIQAKTARSRLGTKTGETTSGLVDRGVKPGAATSRTLPAQKAVVSSTTQDKPSQTKREITMTPVSDSAATTSNSRLNSTVFSRLGKARVD